MTIKLRFVLLTILFLLGCNSENIEKLKHKADSAFEQHDFDEAVKILDNLLKIEPNNSELHYKIGEAYKKLAFMFHKNGIEKDADSFNKSINHFKNTIELSDNSKNKFIPSPKIKLMTLWSMNSLYYATLNKEDSVEYSLNSGNEIGVYSNAILEYNKNILTSCEENAILFTNGDIDTFPIWFLQFVSNFRKDVSVINLNLLNETWYVKFLKNNYFFGDNNVKLNMNDAEIINVIPSRWEVKEIQISNQNVNAKNSKSITWLLNPTINNKGLRVQDLFLLEILKANIFQRPIYFSTSVPKINFIGLDEYLSLEGLVYKLGDIKKELSLNSIYKNCIEKYSYNSINDNESKNITEIKNLNSNYKYLLYKLTTKLSEVNDSIRAQTSFDLLIKLFPELALSPADKDLKTILEKLKEVI